MQNTRIVEDPFLLCAPRCLPVCHERDKSCARRVAAGDGERWWRRGRQAGSDAEDAAALLWLCERDLHTATRATREAERRYNTTWNAVGQFSRDVPDIRAAPTSQGEGPLF